MGVFDPDAERAPLGKTRRGDANGVTDRTNGIGGYSIVQADSDDAAARTFGKDHPICKWPGTWVEVVEIMKIPGM